MTAKKYDYIIIYSFLCASILSIAALARLFVITELKMDNFSGIMAFIVVCLLLTASYLSFQSIINDWLLPKVECIFRKKYPQVEPTLDLISITPPAIQENMNVPNYEEYRLTAQQKIQQEQSLLLENVLIYTSQELSLYMDESEIQKLCEHIRFFQYATEQECDKIQSSVTVNSKLRPIDLMHFGWNIGNQFKKSGIETATFIKRVFAQSLQDSEISTLKRKLRVEGTCIIQIKEKL